MLDLVRAMREPLAYRSEIALKRDFTQKALASYLGDEPANRVLSGSIRRGDVEEIEAVIWFSDLRGFTAFSGTRPAAETAALLGDYFQAVVDVVRGSGGEVLKFMGDGVLAVFRVSDSGVTEACSAAASAALALMEALSVVDAKWQTVGARCRAGVALHVGTVIYGNVGAVDRLDFTVIGPAVNLASRVEGCGDANGASIFVTEAFAAQTSGLTRFLDTVSLKGVPEPVPIYTLADTGESA